MTERPSAPTEMLAIGSSPDDPVIRILLMGRKGSGKRSSLNTILGEIKFKVQKKKKATVYEEVTQIAGKKVCVIKYPDLLDPDLSKEEEEKLKEQLISGCSAGLSSVLITVPLEKPVENEEEILHYVKTLFGPEVQKFIMILFTHGDELEDLDEPQTIEEYLKEHEDLQRLVTECGGKFHCFDNKSKSDDQRRELLLKIEGTIEENKGTFIMKQMKRTESKEYIINFSAKDLGEIQIPEKTRVVLLGKTGAGKSATGNTIIGRNRFKSSISSKSKSRVCQSETTVRFGKEITVIDTPGLYDTKMSEHQTTTEIYKCITHASPGPHAFLIVIKVGRFTEEEKNTVEKLKEAFGEHMEKYSMILFTHNDQLKNKNKSIEEFLQNGDPDLKNLVDRCGNRFFCLDNESASFPQFKDLIGKIEKMVEENGGHFTNEMFNETEKDLKEIQKKKLGEKVKQFKQEEKQVSQTEWQKIFWRLVEESRNEAKQTHTDTFIKEFFMKKRVNVPEIRSVLKNVVTPEEREGAIEEAQRQGISHGKAVSLAVKASRKLAKNKMCKQQ